LQGSAAVRAADGPRGLTASRQGLVFP